MSASNDSEGTKLRIEERHNSSPVYLGPCELFEYHAVILCVCSYLMNTTEARGKVQDMGSRHRIERQAYTLVGTTTCCS